MADEDVERLEKRIDDMQNRAWWILGLLIPLMMIGAGTAIAVWADTQSLKKNEATHAIAKDVDKVNRLQNRALNWQTQAIEAIADKLDVNLPSRPRMIEEDDGH